MSGRIFPNVRCRYSLDTVKGSQEVIIREDEDGFAFSQKLMLTKDFSFDRN